MKKLFSIVVFGLFLFGTGVIIGLQFSDKPTTCPRPIFLRETPPTWTSVTFEGFSIEIPHSREWKVENPQCLWEEASYDPVIYTVIDNGEIHEMLFGRPSNNLSNIGSEYSLTVRNASPMDTDIRPDNWSCLNQNIETPKEMKVGDIQGWRYFRGGAKWCEIVYQFNHQKKTFTLSKNLEPDTHQNLGDTELSMINEEMERIITSIHP